MGGAGPGFAEEEQVTGGAGEGLDVQAVVFVLAAVERIGVHLGADGVAAPGCQEGAVQQEPPFVAGGVQGVGEAGGERGEDRDAFVGQIRAGLGGALGCDAAAGRSRSGSDPRTRRRGPARCTGSRGAECRDSRRRRGAA
jgi:hypothetical protein